ncbi:MAG: metallophosphoesterase family protein [Candidatus Omnitrophota bacterium]
MRYAIFSDVHANLEAFLVVCEYYRNEPIDKFVFLGDIVGYGANPRETTAILMDLNPIAISGNHDWAATEKFDIRFFNPHARAAMVWTREQLSRDDRCYLASFPLTHQEKEFICSHGSLNNPEKFNYIWGIAEATLIFPLFKERIFFMGHSHKMEGYCLKNKVVSYIFDQTIPLEPDARYIINVGSVGQPRDRNPRSCACIYDTDSNVVTFTRLEYNIQAAAQKIIDNGLPAMFASRLSIGC